MVKDYYHSDDDDDYKDEDVNSIVKPTNGFAGGPGSVVSMSKFSTTGSEYGGGGDDSSGKDEDEDIAKQETKQVDVQRYIVLLVLFVAAASVSVCVYALTKRSENQGFETFYNGVAAKALESFQEIITEKLFGNERTCRHGYCLCSDPEAARPNGQRLALCHHE